VHAQPVHGSFPPAFAAARLTAWRAGGEASLADGPGPLGFTAGVRGSLFVSRARPLEAGTTPTEWSYGRATFVANLERPFGEDRLVLRTAAAAVTGRDAPPQAQVLLGGPVSGPGFGYHEFGANAGGTEHLEWRHRALDVPVSIGRFGRLGMPITFAPFLHAIWIDREVQDPAAAGGWFPSAGLGVITLFDFLRFDVARGLRGGRWTFAVDFSRDLWRIL
jgi:hemolysin activation/secretion protein